MKSLYDNKLSLVFVCAAMILASFFASAESCIGHEDPADPTWAAFTKALQGKSILETDWQMDTGIKYTYALKNGQLIAHVLSIPKSAILKMKGIDAQTEVAEAFGALQMGLKIKDYQVSVCQDGSNFFIDTLGGTKVKVVPTAKGMQIFTSAGDYKVDRMATKTAVQ
jgi:hypothetical protein